MIMGAFATLSEYRYVDIIFSVYTVYIGFEIDIPIHNQAEAYLIIFMCSVNLIFSKYYFLVRFQSNHACIIDINDFLTVSANMLLSIIYNSIVFIQKKKFMSILFLLFANLKDMIC